MITYDYNGTKVYLQKEEYRNNGTLAVLIFKEGPLERRSELLWYNSPMIIHPYIELPLQKR